MAIFPERDTRAHLCCLVISYDLEARYAYDLATDPFLIRDTEVAYRLIFASCIALHPFEFFRFLDHFLGDETELSSLMSKDVCLVFIGLDFFIETRVSTVLCFYTSLHLLERIIVVSYELLDLSTPDIEIEDPIGKTIQELSIM